jgi:hypothetical protein
MTLFTEDIIEEKRYCSYCKKRHPIGDFQKGQYVCKWGRAQQQQENAEKNRQAPKPVDYEKYCKRCDRNLNAEKHFKKDMSRPDGYFLYCKECDLKERKAKLSKTKNLNALTGKPKQFRTAILRTILRTVKDTGRSITQQLVEDFRHEGEPISFTGREWQVQILNDLRPNVIVRKPSQKGLTWVLERFIITLLMRYATRPYHYKDHTGKDRSRFIEGIYSFETSDKASKWSKIRLKKIKDDNPHIRDALKVGETDSALLMKFGRTALHLVGRATIGQVLSISGDIVIIDEKDRDQDLTVSTQIGSRTLESEFMCTESTKGITRETSTPEASGAGISLQYEDSTQAGWEIYCVKCETWQILTYPKCIGNFYEKGQEPEKDEKGNELTPFWRCMNCHTPIDWKTIGKWNPEDPDYYENCRWADRKPSKYNAKTGKGIGGYQVPFASPQRSAAFFIAERDDPDHDISYLYNHMLGLPYDDVTKTLVADNFHTYPEFNWGYTSREKYVLGCDTHPSQGGYIVICRQIRNSISPAKPEGKWVVVYKEHVKKNRELWDDTETIKDIDTIKKGRLYELITEYNVSIAVIDLEPDTNEVEKLIEEFAFSKKVWGNKSSGTMTQDTFTWIETEIEDGKEKPVCKMHENKVAAIDYYFNKIRFGDILFLEQDKYPSRRLWREYQTAHTNLYKGEVFGNVRKGTIMAEKLAAQNIREVYKKRVNNIHDHWVMATKFCVQGIRILRKISGTNKHIAPPAIHSLGRIPGT